jgi:hypothetical protein
MHEMGCSLVIFLFLSMDGFVVVGVREPQWYLRVKLFGNNGIFSLLV